MLIPTEVRSLLRAGIEKLLLLGAPSSSSSSRSLALSLCARVVASLIAVRMYEWCVEPRAERVALALAVAGVVGYVLLRGSGERHAAERRP